MKPFTFIAAVLFGLIAVAHILRLFGGWEVTRNWHDCSDVGERARIDHRRWIGDDAFAGNAQVTGNRQGQSDLPSASSIVAMICECTGL